MIGLLFVEAVRYLQAVLRHSAWSPEEWLHLGLRDEALVGYAVAVSGVRRRVRGHVGCERALGEVVTRAQETGGGLPWSSLYLLAVELPSVLHRKL